MRQHTSTSDCTSFPYPSHDIFSYAVDFGKLKKLLVYTSHNATFLLTTGDDETKIGNMKQSTSSSDYTSFPTPSYDLLSSADYCKLNYSCLHIILIDVYFVGVSDDDVCMRNKTITSTVCISTPADYSKPTLL